MKNSPVSIFWFRRDLRIEDNTGLSQALSSGFPVVCIFIFDNAILSELEKDDARVNFIYDQLAEIHRSLKKRGSSLLIKKGNVLDNWTSLVNTLNIQNVFCNEDYEPYAMKRDQSVHEFLKQYNISFHASKDQVIFAKKEIMKGDGSPYSVFTPYKKRWLQKLSEIGLAPEVTVPNKFFQFQKEIPPKQELGIEESKIKVKNFQITNLNNYHKNRDYPALDETSYLSPHLRFGTVSIRSLFYKIQQNEVFASELIWREFFMQILYNFSNVIDHNFKRKYDRIEWRNNEEEFQKWKEGKTGYPMVDAGMRQLNQTGYMHNRVRMITAGFLCKHLLIDWRWGEAYFAKKLLDFDLSANNGNWQWAAGTGCDAAPYFRIFNPTEQLKKFDPKGEYIRKWIPEFDSLEYPTPIVDHKFARERALSTYKKGLNETK